MWILEPFVSSSQIASNAAGSNLQIVYMVPNRSYIVGRKRDECEVFVDNDKSISRKHAVITVDDLSNIKQALIQFSDDPIIKPKLSVEDFSKYGTFVVKGTGSPEKLTTNTKTDLDGNWRIRFGVYQSIYMIKHELMIFCVSRLNEQDRKKLATQCKTIDAKYATCWHHQCTHLIVDEKDCIITEKIGLALCLGIPIVTMEYVNQLEKCLTTNLRQTVELPNIENYYAAAENFNWKAYGLTSAPDFKPNPNRKQLFFNKHFSTMSVEMCQKIMPIIESAGGTIDNSEEQIDEKFVNNYLSCPQFDCIIIENMIDPETLEKLKYYGFQLFDEKAIMAAILLGDASNLKTVKLPSIPEPPKPSPKKAVNVMSDEDRTDDELEMPENNNISFEKSQEQKPQVEENFEPPSKKTKPNEKTQEIEKPKVKEEPKKGGGIEIPLSLADDYEMEEPKKITPKKEIKIEKKEVKREKVVKPPFDPDEPTITVEYIDLIKVKEENKPSQTPNSNYPQNGYNAKRFRKVKYDGSTISKALNVNLVANSSLVEDSVNFDADLSTPTKPKEIKLVAKTETIPTLEKKETKKNSQKKESQKKETPPKKESNILDAIGLDDDEDDDDDEPTLLGVRKR